MKELFEGLNTTPQSKYPFEEVDDYWTIEENYNNTKLEVVWSCWDDVSEELHDEDSTRYYFKSEYDANVVVNYLNHG